MDSSSETLDVIIYPRVTTKLRKVRGTMGESSRQEAGGIQMLLERKCENGVTLTEGEEGRQYRGVKRHKDLLKMP